jgi:hypothetical protein
MQPPEDLGKSTPAAGEQRALYAEQVKQLYSNALLGRLATAIHSLILAAVPLSLSFCTTVKGFFLGILPDEDQFIFSQTRNTNSRR